MCTHLVVLTLFRIIVSSRRPTIPQNGIRCGRGWVECRVLKVWIPASDISVTAVLVSHVCCYRLPKFSGLKKPEMYSLTVWGPGVWAESCDAKIKILWRIRSCLFQLVLAASIPWLMATSLQFLLLVGTLPSPLLSLTLPKLASHKDPWHYIFF